MTARDAQPLRSFSRSDLQLGLATEDLSSLDQAVEGLGLVVEIEVLSSEIAVFDTSARHEACRGQRWLCDDDGGSRGAAARVGTQELAAELAVLLC